MNPFLAVARYIVVASHYLGSLAGFKQGHLIAPTLIISSHKHWGRVFCLVGILVGSARATAISMLIFSDRIVVAADSRQVSIDPVTISSTCKIRLIGPYLFVAAGRVSHSHINGSPRKEFDLFAEARAAVAATNNPGAAADKLRTSVLPYLPEIVTDLKKHDPVTYNRIRRGLPVLSFALGGMVAGMVSVFNCEFFSGSNGEIRPNCNAISKNPGEVRWIGKGYSDNAKLLINSSAQSEAFINPVDFVRRGVTLEIEAASRERRNDVAGPIATAIFDRSGLRFLDASACSAERNVKKKQGNL